MAGTRRPGAGSSRSRRSGRGGRWPSGRPDLVDKGRGRAGMAWVVAGLAEVEGAVVGPVSCPAGRAPLLVPRDPVRVACPLGEPPNRPRLRGSPPHRAREPILPPVV